MGKVGRSLSVLFDIPYGAPFAHAVGRTNLYAEPANPAINGGLRETTPPEEALKLFHQLVGTSCRVILLGPVVAGAFGIRDGWMEWRKVRQVGRVLVSVSLADAGTPALVAGAIPYPTSSNVWWADASRMARARTFCRSALR